MKKLIPIIMFSIILFCTGCTNLKSVEIYQSIKPDIELQDLKKLHDFSDIESEDDEGFILNNCSNTILQELAVKYGEEGITVTAYKPTDSEYTLSIGQYLYSKQVCYNDFNDLVEKISELCGEPKKDLRSASFNYNNIDISVHYMENTVIYIFYNFK